MQEDPQAYVQAVLNLYLQLPGTPNRFSRLDRRFALQLYQREVPLSVVEAALLLALARRAARSPQAPPLGPIRSLHYFLPVIEEICQRPVPTSYLLYLRKKVLPCAKASPSAL
ncbi:MAG: hypothetical protein L0387_40360 [Acidobacteria bacterium]|nr:hypothetical protein [Acidobacteriota bacterium]MCI0627842.1 hypothetical protein [Acidobacteriota bacterium]MCI0718206.1 hypothetical protein [Acidobacteriota bacterium]